MKYLHTLIVFLISIYLYAQTPTTVHEEIEFLATPLAFHGDDLYYVSNSDYVYKIDLTSESLTPQAVFNTDTEDSSSIRDMAFLGDDLYISMADALDANTQILKFDLTTNTLSTNPIATIASFGTPIAFLGNELYFVTDKLSKIDVTQQGGVAQVVMMTLPDENNSETFSNFIFDGNILYMASGGDSNNTGVFKVDVAADNPVAEKVVSGNIRGIVLGGNSLYYSSSGSIQKIQDIKSGTLSGADYVTGLTLPSGLVIYNNILYIADPGTNKIVKYPLTPFEGIYNLGSPIVFHEDELYYVSDKNHIYKIDVTAANPTAKSVVSFSEEDNYDINHLAFHDNVLYVSESNLISGSKISKVDLTSNAPSIQEVYLATLTLGSAISFLDNNLYLIDDIDGNFDDEISQLIRLDVTVVNPMRVVLTQLPFSSASDLSFNNNILYTASSFNSNSGIHRIDVTEDDPLAENLIEGNVYGIVFNGNTLYYSSNSSIQKIEDVNSETLVSVDVISGLSQSSSRNLATHNNQLYITGADNEIVVHNLPPPAQIWDGDDLAFTKTAGADWTLETNQDRITDNVWITRQNNRPIYNYKWWQDTFNTDASESDLQYEFFGNGENGATPTQSFTATGGTKGVRWAILDDTGANTENWNNFTLYGSLGNPTHFYSFNNVVTMIDLLEQENNVTINQVTNDFLVNKTDGSGTSEVDKPNDFTRIVGKKLGVWIEDQNIYFTMTFTSWVSGGGGNGGFSYTRSTGSSLGVENGLATNRVFLSPNPVQDKTYVYGLNTPSTYHIYNLLGVGVSEGWVSDQGAIEVSNLPQGLYLIKLQNGNVIKLIKE